MMAPLYDHSTKSLSGLVFGAFTLALSARRERVAIAISASFSAGVSGTLNLSTTNSDNSIWYRAELPLNVTFAYRDFGPIIAESLYVQIDNVATTITLTEIFRVPRT